MISKTWYELPKDKFEKINFESHSSYQGTDSNPDDPQWLERLQNQARMFVELFREKIFDPKWRIIDYGCGDGKLADMVNEKVESNPIKKYDAFMSIRGGTTYQSRISLKNLLM